MGAFRYLNLVDSYCWISWWLISSFNITCQLSWWHKFVRTFVIRVMYCIVFSLCKNRLYLGNRCLDRNNNDISPTQHYKLLELLKYLTDSLHRGFIWKGNKGLGNIHPTKMEHFVFVRDVISLLARDFIFIIDRATQEVPMKNIWKKLSFLFLRSTPLMYRCLLTRHGVTYVRYILCIQKFVMIQWILQ